MTFTTITITENRTPNSRSVARSQKQSFLNQLSKWKSPEAVAREAKRQERDYVLASWISMMPGTVMYVYLVSLARAGVADRERTPAEWTLYAVGLLATITVVVFVTRIARRALTKRTTPVS